MSDPRAIPTAGEPYEIITGQPYSGQTNVKNHDGDEGVCL